MTLPYDTGAAAPYDCLSGRWSNLYLGAVLGQLEPLGGRRLLDLATGTAECASSSVDLRKPQWSLQAVVKIAPAVSRGEVAAALARCSDRTSVGDGYLGRRDDTSAASLSPRRSSNPALPQKSR